MKSLLKFITCGSVDDGKSTLIGHVLYDAKLLFVDQVKALELDSQIGSRDGKIDYSLLLDGLMAEREQGITIDVAYRFFTTEKRSFIVADCPGHEQYTRNMAVGASFADLAVILVDVMNGILPQTKRHARICALMGIKHMVLAVNKMDLIQYDRHRFNQVRLDFIRYVSEFGFESIEVIPVSAVEGDNVVFKSPKTAWYKGLPLLSYLEQIDVAVKSESNNFVMPVQRVSRPSHEYRGYQGMIESGSVKIGDEITCLPTGENVNVKSILNAGTECEEATTGQSIALMFDREVDVSRGCVLASSMDFEIADMFTASILWMDEAPLIVGRSYLVKCGTKVVLATILSIKHKVDISSGNRTPAKQLYKNELAECDISLSEKIVFSTFEENRGLGSFILIDRVSNMTSACGAVLHSLRRSSNISWQKTDITRDIRAGLKNQTPKTLWFTGLSGSGKSALSNALEKRLSSMGMHTMLLDGDNIRHGLNRDLGFTETDRVENIRRVAEVAKLMNEAGLIVLTAFISPFGQDRALAKEIIGKCFKEIYVSTPLEVCEERDIKGLYKKARTGQIPEFTGISSPYEPPHNADIEIDTSDNNIPLDVFVEKLIAGLLES